MTIYRVKDEDKKFTNIWLLIQTLYSSVEEIDLHNSNFGVDGIEMLVKCFHKFEVLQLLDFKGFSLEVRFSSLVSESWKSGLV